MPTKDDYSTDLQKCFYDGELFQLTSYQGFSDNPKDDNGCCLAMMAEMIMSGTVTFSCKANRRLFRKVFGTNNWRKMHHIPMMRKTAAERKRRKRK